MCEGITIFHAGDLNFWSWKKESTEKEIKEAYDIYDHALKDIALQFQDFDIAFFPVDPRMQKDYDEGATDFPRTFRCYALFPDALRDEGKGRSGLQAQIYRRKHYLCP